MPCEPYSHQGICKQLPHSQNTVFLFSVPGKALGYSDSRTWSSIMKLLILRNDYLPETCDIDEVFCLNR
jgi:hypothetical protein